MFGRVFMTALLAGLIGGMFIWSLQMVQTTPLILQAETYETGGHHDHGDAHGHAVADIKEAHDEASAWMPEDGFQRSGSTLLASLIAGVGFSFLLVGAIVLSRREVNLRDGVLWGLCGFAAFYAAPALGLPPELPGMMAADLEMRQVWWLATAVFTAIGLAMLILGGNPWIKALGVVAVVAPQVMGAPHTDYSAGAVPAELAAHFAAASLVTTGLFWVVLGGATGYLYRRFGEA